MTRTPGLTSLTCANNSGPLMRGITMSAMTNVDFSPVFAVDGYRRGPVGGGEDFVAFGFEADLRHLTNHFLVFGKQDAFVSAAGDCRCRRRRGIWHFVRGGQKDFKKRALTGLGLDMDFAAKAFDDILRRETNRAPCLCRAFSL